MLKGAELIPSWKTVLNNIDQHMNKIKQVGIQNVDQLKASLKTTNHVATLAKESGLPVDYVMVLRRVTNAYHPKPNRIQDFPSTPEGLVKKLKNRGINNTFQFYSLILTAQNRIDLASEIDEYIEQIDRLVMLTDLSRIRWVNHTFAFVLLEAGYNTANKVAQADYRELYQIIKQLNHERRLYQGNIGEHDMKLCVESAQGLDFEVSF